MSGEPSTHSANKNPVGRVPEVMRAAAIDRFGGPEVLTVREITVPPVGEDEVLLALHTAGVGSWDAEIRSGWYPEGQPQFPLILGTDGSGNVAAIGSAVRRFAIGDPVYAYSFLNPKGGFYAAYVAVAAEKVAHVPRGLTMREAGAIPTTGLTAIQGIDDVLGIRRGDALVIVGASGGVGTLAVQFAKLREARVLAIASGADGVRLVTNLGADVATDGRSADLSGELRMFAPEGVKTVLAFAGGPVLDRILESIAGGGRLAYPNGVEPQPRGRSGVRLMAYDARPGVREFSHLTTAAEAANLRVPIDTTFPLDAAAESHRRLERGHVLGKVVLDII